jgi:hypothetical protein
MLIQNKNWKIKPLNLNLHSAIYFYRLTIYFYYIQHCVFAIQVFASPNEIAFLLLSNAMRFEDIFI